MSLTSLYPSSDLLALRVDTVAELVTAHRNNLKGFSQSGSPLKGLQKQGYLYRCELCGEMKILLERLDDDNLQHSCNLALLHSRGRLLQLLETREADTLLPLGALKLCATGSIDELVLWAHSLQLGLDQPLKGI